jgi:hypothetical protein
LDDLVATIFRMMKAARSSKTLVYYCNIAWCQNPEDLNLNLHYYENLNLATFLVFYCREADHDCGTCGQWKDVFAVCIVRRNAQA